MLLKCETAMLQDRAEIARLAKLALENGVRRYLEIGCKHGGSLWYIANALPKGSLIVALDLPHGDQSFKESQPHLEACVDALRKRGYNTDLILADSTDPLAIARVRAWAPFDLCFIDACHLETFVWQDWHNYGPMSRMVAFHDIAQTPNPHKISKKMPIQVQTVWNKIKGNYRHEEIKLCSVPDQNGIGVLWQ
jgi:predicted O-methyltransferase YrrM